MKNTHDKHTYAKARSSALKILDLIYKSNGISKNEIAQVTGLSSPTVSQHITALLDKGIVEMTGLADSTGGRKAFQYAVSNGFGCALGIEITCSYFNLVMVNMRGDILYHERIYRNFELNDFYLESIVRESNAFARMAPSSILGCGIAIPGTINANKNILVKSFPLALENVCLDVFGQKLSYPCTYVNDASAAAYAEFYTVKDNLVRLYLSLNDTVGGSIYLGDRPYDVYHQAMGNGIGHVVLYPGGQKCFCGKNGCATLYCGASRLAKESAGILDDFFVMLDKGVPEIKTVWLDYLDALSIMISNFIISLDCQVVLGGYVGGYMDQYMDELYERLAPFMNGIDLNRVTPCAVQRKAAAVGAALIVIQDYITAAF